MVALRLCICLESLSIFWSDLSVVLRRWISRPCDIIISLSVRIDAFISSKCEVNLSCLWKNKRRYRDMRLCKVIEWFEIGLQICILNVYFQFVYIFHSHLFAYWTPWLVLPQNTVTKLIPTPYMTTCLTWKMGNLPNFLIWKRVPTYLSNVSFPAHKSALACKINCDQLALFCLFELFTTDVKLWKLSLFISDMTHRNIKCKSSDLLPIIDSLIFLEKGSLRVNYHILLQIKCDAQKREGCQVCPVHKILTVIYNKHHINTGSQLVSSLYQQKQPPLGIEPRTAGLQDQRSATEL